MHLEVTGSSGIESWSSGLVFGGLESLMALSLTEALEAQGTAGHGKGQTWLNL